MSKTFYEAIIAQGGFAGQVFDVAAGPANTDVIDALLSASDGVLTENAPVNMISTGALSAGAGTDGIVDLDITALEQEGRWFWLSVRNSDIGTISLTVTSTTDINGGGATLTISSAQDLLFVHESGGTWRAYRQELSTAPTNAKIFRDTFAASDWSGGPTNSITVIQTGAPGAGEIGPHGLAIASSYAVQVYRDSDDELVDLGTVVDGGTGDITLTKTGLGTNFDGRVIVVGD